MPLIYYLCKCGKAQSKFYRVAKDAPSSLDCANCGDKFKKQLSAPSNASKIVIDNGVMSKSVEVDLKVVESNLENSTKDFREKD